MDARPDFLRLAEAAEVARVSTKTIQRALRDARRPLRHHRIGRRVIISRVDLHRWLDLHVVMPCQVQGVSAPVRELLGRLNGTPAAPEICK